MLEAERLWLLNEQGKVSVADALSSPERMSLLTDRALLTRRTPLFLF